MDILKIVKELDFPSGEYIVVGSGPMVARDLRKANDVDLVVTPKLFEKCRNEGWQQVPWTYEKPGQIYLKRGDVELYLDVNCKDFNPTLSELLSRADIIEGIPFASLDDTKKFKRAYNKPKHLKDIEIIEKFEQKL